MSAAPRARPATPRIGHADHRKRLLLDKMTKALAPVARVLLGALAVELRKTRAAVSDASLLNSLLVDGIERVPACAEIADRFASTAGIRILSHERRLVRENRPGTEFILTVTLALDIWSRQLRQALGKSLSPVLEAEVHASRNGVGASRLLGLDELDLADLEQVHLVFQTYWLDNLAMIATPTTGLRRGART